MIEVLTSILRTGVFTFVGFVIGVAYGLTLKSLNLTTLLDKPILLFLPLILGIMFFTFVILYNWKDKIELIKRVK